MKKTEAIKDLEIYIDPKPLSNEEAVELGLFIKQLKAKSAQLPTHKLQRAGQESKHLLKR
jgi:hypothetical protein